ncbi:MAG: signal recognition particle-docking protein FtsY, partial [Clostridia bacterium]|nr:signal recognition particle-docking protein FtsY [Clostridia bacterium]
MGLFSKLKSVLSKTRDGISKKLTELFAKNKLGEEFYEDLEDILISSDVSVNTTMEIVDEIRETAIKEKCKDKDYVIDLLKKELYETLSYADVPEFKSPAVIMVVGVNGVGKTTTIGKLANKFVKEKKTVTIAAADTFRAAASDQLSVWADRAGVRIIKHAEGADASAVVYDAIASAKSKNTDVLIIDTAGRLHVKSNLMEELKKMDRVVKREFPDCNYYKLIALDATTGQNAYNQVEVFNEA